MELHYDITEQDYIDFNLSYFNGNPVVQRSIMITRVATALIVIAGGTMLMYFLGSLGLVPALVYLALAAVCFFGTPWYMKRKVIKNTSQILQNAGSKQLCGRKTLILREDEFELKGENEGSVYRYEGVQRITTDEKHYYIFVDERSGVIVPFSAFSDEWQKHAFYDRISARMENKTENR